MLYVALTFWLLIMVFAAHGIYQLWAGLVQPRIINVVLLPGTIIAQFGRIVGLLLTGGTINDTLALTGSTEATKSKTKVADQKVRVVGPIILALLPLMACVFSIYVVLLVIGQEVFIPLNAAGGSAVGLPTTFDSFWDVLRGSLAMVEQVATVVSNSDFKRWETWLFIYLIICLTVRMAPLPGTKRSAIGAVLILGIGSAVVGLTSQTPESSVQAVWNLLNFSVGSLLFLLLVTLIVRGGVGLFRILTNSNSNIYRNSPRNTI